MSVNKVMEKIFRSTRDIRIRSSSICSQRDKSLIGAIPDGIT